MISFKPLQVPVYNRCPGEFNNDTRQAGSWWMTSMKDGEDSDMGICVRVRDRRGGRRETRRYVSFLYLISIIHDHVSLALHSPLIRNRIRSHISHVHPIQSSCQCRRSTAHRGLMLEARTVREGARRGCGSLRQGRWCDSVR
jgi:hypothetical protein